MAKNSKQQTRRPAPEVDRPPPGIMAADRPSMAGGGMVEGIKAKQFASIQAAYTIAKHYPRDEAVWRPAIIKACQNSLLAMVAEYRYPRGDTQIVGPSIELVRVVARCYGNLNFGIEEIEQREGQSIMRAFCHDLETNTCEERTFTARHAYKANERIKEVSDPRDVYEATFNFAARRLRACIEGVIEKSVFDMAVGECRRTMAALNKNEPLEKRLQIMLETFKAAGIPQAAIEKRLKHKVTQCTETELVQLGRMWNAIRDHMAKPSDFFEVDDANVKTPAQMEEGAADQAELEFDDEEGGPEDE